MSHRQAVKARQLTRELLRRPEALTTIFLVGVVVYFSFATSMFLTSDNWTAILSTMAPLGIVSVGQTLVLVAGGFDLSVAGVTPLAAVVYGSVAGHLFSPAEAFVVILIGGAATGLVSGVLVVYVRINPLITTLATMSVTGGAAYLVTTGGVSLDPRNSGFMANQLVPGLTYSVLVWLVIVVVGGLAMAYTVFGRMLYSVGGNREASWMAGLPVGLMGVLPYVISGTLSALAGISLAGNLLSADGTLASNYALNSITAVVLGGAALTGGSGTLAGTLIGILLLGVLQNGLTLLHVNTFYQQIVTGLALLAALGFRRVRARRL